MNILSYPMRTVIDGKTGNQQVHTMETHHIRILIIDDEEELRVQLAPILVEEGYHVTEAKGGKEAIEILLKEKFPIVLLDIRMPDVNGIEVLKFIRDRHPTTNVIMLTAYGDLKQAMECKALGADDFIEKPYNIADLLAVLEYVLRKAHHLPS